jgi:NADPH-dependent 2,4-dienoyl-CoA reductase/sulfur reductase-like enzyme
MQYDKVLVATGGDARAFVPKEGFSIPGSTLRGIFVLRDAADIRGITTALALGSPGKKVVVVGSSFIGMEAAAFLAKKTKSRKGLPAPVSSVTVVGMESVPFERVLGATIGGMIQQRAEAEGVRFHMKDVVNEFVALADDDSALGEVELRSGETLEADLVIIGAGIIPATGWLANAAGISIKEPRAGGGVQCDEFLCAHPSGDVFVAGDVAHFPYAHATSDDTRSLRIEHYDVAMDHGRVAARNMLGRKVPYEVVPFFWTGLFKLKIRYAGHARTIDDVIIHGSLGDASTVPAFTAYYVTGEVISGAVTVNDDPNAVACLELLRARTMPSAQEIKSSSSFDPVKYLAKQQS